MNLTLVQWLAIRELGPLLGSSELVVLIIVVAFFSGMSIGYLVAPWLSRRWLIALALGTVAVHATLPFSTRVAAALFHAVNLAGNVPPLVFLLVLLGVSPFYATVMPLLAQELKATAKIPLGRIYATELSGSLLGLVAIVLIAPLGFPAVMVLHFTGLVALTGAMCPEIRRGPLVVLPLAYALIYSWADRPSLELFYRFAVGFRAPRVLASEVSPYNRVDVVSESGSSGAPELYLDGVKYYGGSTLNRHNLMVSILPNLFMATRRRPRSLVIGAGSLDSARYLAPVSDLTVVEIDEAVPRLTRMLIQEPRGSFPGQWKLEIDDAARHVAQLPAGSVDVLSVDVPVPLSIQTARFHGPGFFTNAKACLRPDGLFAISLSGSVKLQKNGGFFAGEIAHRVLAGLRASFSHVAVLTVNSGAQAFAWASDQPIDVPSERLDALARQFAEASGARNHFHLSPVTRLPEPVVEWLASGHRPVGDADMQLVLNTTIRKLVNRYYRR